MLKQQWRRTAIVASTFPAIEYKISVSVGKLNKRPNFGTRVSLQPGYYTEKWRRIKRLHREGYRFDHQTKKWEKVKNRAVVS